MKADELVHHFTVLEGLYGGNAANSPLVRQRLILYVNEYGDGAKIPDFECSAAIESSSVHFHNIKSRSQRAGKRDFFTYTGTAEYSIEKIDENAMQLLRIGLLIGAGPKPSFGLGFLKMIDSKDSR